MQVAVPKFPKGLNYISQDKTDLNCSQNGNIEKYAHED